MKGGMPMAGQDLSGVVLKESIQMRQRTWVICFILVNCFYIVVIVGLLRGNAREKKTFPIFSDLRQPLEEYRTKDKLYGILRTKGYSLGQGLDIVEATVRNSRELGLPLALIMAVIHEESEFYPNARSDKGAQGLMQIMPDKWDEYVGKLNLKVDRRAITDPLMNISVGSHILKDLYDRYSHIEDHKTRMAKVLTDYNNGENATNPNLEYAIQVSRRKMEYEKKLQ
jgi:soluble lytic murein transglycosylase-like protein